MLLKNEKGQASFSEYAVLIVLVIAAVTTMQLYFRRGLQGGIKAMADRIEAKQYSPTNTQSNYEVLRGSNTHESMLGNRANRPIGETVTTTESNEFEKRQGRQVVNVDIVEE